MSVTYFLIITLLMTIPTSVVVLHVGLSIQGSRVALKRMLPYASIAGLVLSTFRVIPVPFGLHTLLYVAVVIAILRHLSQGRWSMAVLGGLLTTVLAAVGEGLVAVPIVAMLGVSVDEVLRNPWQTVASGWMGNSLLVLLSLYFLARGLFARREAR